jgi:hypothetical protein
MEKKEREKGCKKGYCETPGWGSLFSGFFGSLSPFHAAWVLLSFLKGRIPPQILKKDWGQFFWIL